MTSNMPILYRNILDSLPSQIARDAFLWATERPGEDRNCYRAERFSHEVGYLTSTLPTMLDMAARIGVEHGIGTSKTHSPDLMRFILTRHANWRFGGNVSPSYLESTQ